MVECEECGKKLYVLQGYRHPALGISFLVCSKCFVKVDEDMKRWSKFCLLNSSDIELSKIDIQDAWDKNISNNLELQKWFRNLWIKIGSKTLVE